jgi:hypothetical protein
MEHAIQFLIEAAGKWGLGIVLALIIVLMFRRFLMRYFDLVERNGIRYQQIVDRQNDTIDNHITHLTQSVEAVTKGLNKNNIALAKQGESLNQGFNRIVDAINNQTRTIENLHQKPNPDD